MSTFAAGKTLPGATLEALVDGWTNYTPAWTGSTTDPVIVNGTIAGRYKRQGSLVHFAMFYTAGAGDTFGSGFYSMSVPVAASASAIQANILCQYFDTSAVAAAQYLQGIGQLDAGASTVIRIRLMGGNNANATIANWSATFPAGPAAGDQFGMSGTYEAAAV